ncbi:MAG: hypothetical protein ABWZ75_03185 [Novosphingobium sp.]
MDPTLVIFLLTYLVIAIGYLPGFRIDRTGAALLGAIAMIVSERSVRIVHGPQLILARFRCCSG